MSLFLEDNGACLCEKHLGVSARFTGRDISGQSIYPVSQGEIEYAISEGFCFRCETCGATK